MFNEYEAENRPKREGRSNNYVVITGQREWNTTMNRKRQGEVCGHRADQHKFRRLSESGSCPVFSVNPIHKYDIKFPFFRQPVEVGAFSLDIERKFTNDRSQMQHYIKPSNPRSVNFDLRQGYKDMIRKDESVKEYINDILRWILACPEKFVVNNGKLQQDESSSKMKRQLNTDFVCWRGLLTKFLCTPYENRDGWLVAVTLYNGTFYLCEFDTEDKKHQKENTTEKQDEMCCWGWKFEQYVTADSQKGKPDTSGPYNNTEAFCTVVRSRLNTHSLVFSGEVDAISCDSGGKEHYVEFKTTREIDNPRQDKNFKRFKLIKWWAQSFLVGIPEIVCGYRDDEGIVYRLESFQTLKIPELVKDLYECWKPTVCFNFLDQLLSFIKCNIKVDDQRVVHLLEWNPKRDVTCRKLARGSDYVFLPDWYTDVSVK